MLQTFGALLVTALLAAPAMWIFSLLPWAASLFGGSVIFGLIFFIRHWTASVKKIYDQYGLISTHRSHLGMQAVIGDDLSLLINSWTKPAQTSSKYIFAFPIGLVIIAVLWIIFAISAPSAASVFTEYLGINADFEPKQVQPLYLLSLTVWAAISVVFSYSLLDNSDRIDRLLLIIDDLDRCHAEEIVDIIDGVKMILDDDALGASIQALILADKDVLKLSIKRRMNETFTEEKATLAAVEEHIEKVFLCHLEVPKLDYNDTRELVNSYADEFGVQDQDQDQDQDYLEGKILQKDFDRRSSYQRDRQPSPPEINFVLSKGERTSIQNALRFMSSSSGKSLTPRLIRSFMFKYQICRALLQMQRLDFDHGEVTDYLAKNISGKFDENDYLQNDRLLNIVKMVL